MENDDEKSYVSNESQIDENCKKHLVNPSHTTDAEYTEVEINQAVTTVHHRDGTVDYLFDNEDVDKIKRKLVVYVGQEQFVFYNYEDHPRHSCR